MTSTSDDYGVNELTEATENTRQLFSRDSDRQTPPNYELTDGANSELSASRERQRERGRRAQRAFRKRQIDTIQRLEGRLAVYANAFNDVRHALATLQSAFESSLAVQPELAPVTTVQNAIATLKRSLSKIGTASISVAQRSGTSQPRNEVSSPVYGNDVAEASVIGTQYPSALAPVPQQVDLAAPASQCYTTNTPDWNSTQHVANQTVAIPEPAVIDTFSEWQPEHPSAPPEIVIPSPLTQHVQQQVPFPDSIPYLGAAAQTIAGQIYWSTMQLAYNILSGQDIQSQLGRNMFQYTALFRSLGAIRTAVKARLVYKSVGVLLEQSDPLSIGTLSAQISDALRQNDTNPHLWLSAHEVEAYVRHKYLKQAPREHATSAELIHAGSSNQTENTNRWNEQTSTIIGSSMLGAITDCLVSQLGFHSVCFGNGPRYHVETIDSLITQQLSIAS